MAILGAVPLAAGHGMPYQLHVLTDWARFVTLRHTVYGIPQADMAILDEIDSGLDIDALRDVAKAVNALKGEETGVLMVTHYKVRYTLQQDGAVRCHSRMVWDRSGRSHRLPVHDAMDPGAASGEMGHTQVAPNVDAVLSAIDVRVYSEPARAIGPTHHTRLPVDPMLHAPPHPPPSAPAGLHPPGLRAHHAGRCSGVW